MQRGIELFAGICFLVIGLSHLIQPAAWVEFFDGLRSRGRSGAFAEGFILLGFGAFVVAFHNVWSGLPTVLTLVGWLQVVKGLLRFTAPKLCLRIYERVSLERAWEFQAAGVFSLALGGLFTYTALLP